MITYSIYLPASVSSANQSENGNFDVKFLPDGRAWFAVFVPPIWLIWHRLWWALVVYIAIAAIPILLVMTPWRDAAIFLSALPGLYLLLEGHELVRQRYERHGWRFIGISHGKNVEEAELRYLGFQQNAKSGNTLVNTASVNFDKPGKPRPTRPRTETIGLFPLDQNA